MGGGKTTGHQANQDYSILEESKKDLDKIKRAIKFRILVKTTEICKRLCSYAFTELEWLDYDEIMLILIDRFRNPAAAKKVYHILKSIGFIEESIVESSYLEELKQPEKSRRLMSYLRRRGIRNLEDLLENPSILNEINYDPDFDYLIELNNGQVRVFKKLKGYKWKLSELAREVCQEESTHLF